MESSKFYILLDYISDYSITIIDVNPIPLVQQIMVSNNVPCIRASSPMAIPDLKDPTPAPPTNLGHEQNQPCQVYFEPDEIDGTLESYIFSLIHERYEKQKLIDEGRYVKKGPGRNRKFQMTTTKEVKKFVDLFFLERVNKYNNKRTDA